MERINSINKKIKLMESIKLIINGVSIIISLLSLFVFGTPEKVLALIGTVIMLALTIFLAIKTKLLKSDKNIIEECLIVISDINNLINVIKANIDLSTLEGKELLDIVSIKEISLNSLIKKMNKLKGRKLEYYVYLTLKRMLQMLELHKSLYFSESKQEEEPTAKAKVILTNKSKYLNVLGLNDNVTDWNIIKNAYRKLCKIYHTDINKSKDSLDKMKEINIAYSELERKFT